MTDLTKFWKYEIYDGNHAAVQLSQHVGDIVYVVESGIGPLGVAHRGRYLGMDGDYAMFERLEVYAEEFEDLAEDKSWKQKYREISETRILVSARTAFYSREY
jgi:hypothetical protein